MDVDSFIAKYRPEWQQLERACAHGTRGLAKLPGEEIERVVDLYQRTSTHLAEARTRYRDPGLLDYLNALVARTHVALYGSRARSLRGFLRFFGPRYREALRRTVPFIAVAAGLLLAVTLATTWWVAHSAEARAGLLPPLAEESIRRAGGGRPELGVPSSQLSTFILLNNLQVAFLSFALGISLCAGTLYILAKNAVTIGALAGAYHSADAAGQFWSLILPHGLLEITAICIAAGAGIRMGWALIDPGDRPRGRALTEDARDSVMVLVGVIPAFAIAAAIEGFLTGTSVPGALQLGIGAAAAAGYLYALFGPVRAARTP